MKWPLLTRRNHERLMMLERQWSMMEARTRITYLSRVEARDAYAKGRRDERGTVIEKVKAHCCHCRSSGEHVPTCPYLAVIRSLAASHHD